MVPGGGFVPAQTEVKMKSSWIVHHHHVMCALCSGLRVSRGKRRLTRTHGARDATMRSTEDEALVDSCSSLRQAGILSTTQHPSGTCPLSYGRKGPALRAAAKGCIERIPTPALLCALCSSEEPARTVLSSCRRNDALTLSNTHLFTLVHNSASSH